MTAKFNRLGFFNPGRAISAPASSRQWRDHYRKLIRRIRNNEATDIPGFANLREFSEHPSIQEMIKDEIKDEWGSKAMTFGGLGVALQSKAMSPASSRSLVSGLVHRIANYQSPQIVFTMRNQAFDTHTVLASAVRRQSDGSTWICLRDNNSSGDNRKGCDNRLIVHETGEVSSTKYGDIGGVVVGANENADTVAQIHSLVAKCRGDKKCGS